MDFLFEDKGDPRVRELVRQLTGTPGKATAIDSVKLVQGMANSTFNMILWHAHKDLKDLAEHPELALQIGIGIALDKPTLVIARDNEPVPRALRKLADKIITTPADYKSRDFQVALHRGMLEFIRENPQLNLAPQVEEAALKALEKLEQNG